MNKIWTVLLQKAIAALMSTNWPLVISEVMALMTVEASGREKRELAFMALRKYGIDCATWLLYAAIEIAYGSLKK